MTSDARNGVGIVARSVLRSCSMKSMTMKTLRALTLAKGPLSNILERIGTYCVRVSPTTISRTLTIFS